MSKAQVREALVRRAFRALLSNCEQWRKQSSARLLISRLKVRFLPRSPLKIKDLFQCSKELGRLFSSEAGYAVVGVISDLRSAFGLAPRRSAICRVLRQGRYWDF